MPIRCIFKKKNTDKTQRNGQTPESKTIVKYITQTGMNGYDGTDSYQVVLSPNNKTFTAGSYNAHQQTHTLNVYAYRGTTQINAYVFDSSITGKYTGILDASVVPGTNGTDHTQILISVTEELSADAGELKIPVQYNIDSTDASSNMIASEWDPATNSLAVSEVVFSWTLGKTGESIYTLNLSNDRATINTDENGVPYDGAVRPPCVAKLAFGANDNLTGVYYDAFCSPAAQGFTINHSTGEFLYDHAAHVYDSTIPDASFNFGDASTNTVLNIRVDASYDGRVQARKTMVIEKALPGQQGPQGETGDPAISRWINLSADIVKIDASNNIVPPTITATKYKQIGGNTPIVDTSANINIKWFHDSSAEQAYTAPVEVSATWNNITFKLYDGNTFIGESETVPIIKDGKDGNAGQRGASLRGPVLWDSSNNVNISGLSERWFYCGVLGDDGRPDANKYIDVILHDGQYYICTENYKQGPNATWGSVYPNYWTVADASYNFVAANVILAQNAGIDFLTGNEIYLKDSNGYVTAGAAGGNGISFWAGGAKDASANFVVNYDGTMTAKKGQFGCLSIGTDSNFGSVLTGSYEDSDNIVRQTEINPSFIRMSSGDESVTISANPDTDKLDVDALVDVICDSSDNIGISTNAYISAGTLAVKNARAPHPSIIGKAGAAVITPGLFNLEVVFQTSTDSSTDYFTKNSSTGTWYFNGINTQVSYSQYPYVAVQTIVEGEQSVIKLGYWAYYASSSGAKVFSGIAGPNIQKQSGIIYIKI